MTTSHRHCSSFYHVLLCLENWGKLGFIKAEDVQAVVAMAEEEKKEHARDVGRGWDAITHI